MTLLSKVEAKMVKMYNRIAMRMVGVKTEEGDHLVEVLGTIVIAVAILFLFQNQLRNMFNSLTERTVNEINTLFPTH